MEIVHAARVLLEDLLEARALGRRPGATNTVFASGRGPRAWIVRPRFALAAAGR
jgi:hypothetical protein